MRAWHGNYEEKECVRKQTMLILNPSGSESQRNSQSISVAGAKQAQPSMAWDSGEQKETQSGATELQK